MYVCKYIRAHKIQDGAYKRTLAANWKELPMSGPLNKTFPSFLQYCSAVRVRVLLLRYLRGGRVSRHSHTWGSQGEESFGHQPSLSWSRSPVRIPFCVRNSWQLPVIDQQTCDTPAPMAQRLCQRNSWQLPVIDQQTCVTPDMMA